jgi:hypothetical protein
LWPVIAVLQGISLQAGPRKAEDWQHLSVSFPILEGIEEGWIALITVTVDPPTPGRPGGEIWESNEEDNSRSTGLLCTIITPGSLPTHDPGIDPAINPRPHHQSRKKEKKSNCVNL